MLEKLIEKISQQQAGKENTDVWMVGEQLKDICRRVPSAAEIVLQDLDIPEMSIDKAAGKIKEYADKLHKEKKGGRICVPPNAAEGIIAEFYGIKGLIEAADANSQAIENTSGNTGFIDLKSFL